jgi:hypothetical protein
MCYSFDQTDSPEAHKTPALLASISVNMTGPPTVCAGFSQPFNQNLRFFLHISSFVWLRMPVGFCIFRREFMPDFLLVTFIRRNIGYSTSNNNPALSEENQIS